MHTAGPNKNHMVTFKSTAPKQSLRRPIFLRNMHYELHGSILAFYWFHFGLLTPEKVSKNGKIY